MNYTLPKLLSSVCNKQLTFLLYSYEASKATLIETETEFGMVNANVYLLECTLHTI